MAIIGHVGNRTDLNMVQNRNMQMYISKLKIIDTILKWKAEKLRSMYISLKHGSHEKASRLAITEKHKRFEASIIKLLNERANLLEKVGGNYKSELTAGYLNDILWGHHKVLNFFYTWLDTSPEDDAVHLRTSFKIPDRSIEKRPDNYPEYPFPCSFTIADKSYRS